MRQLLCDVCGELIPQDRVTYHDFPCVNGKKMDIVFITTLASGLYDLRSDVCFNCQAKMLPQLIEPRDQD